ncbi:MAG: DUF3096 domain-containing protein [Smithella sp.]
MESSSKDNKDGRDNIPILNIIAAVYLIIIGIFGLLR